MEARAGSSKAVEKKPQSNTITFRKPDSTLFSSKDGVFPPTIFSDVIYSKGIRLFPESIQEDSQNVSLSYSYDYTTPMTAATKKSLKVKAFRNSSFPNGANSVPMLDSQDVLLWSHKRAAKSAAEQHWPMPIFRLLGVISREVLVADNDSPLNTVSLPPDFPAAPKVKKQSRMSMQAAMSEARAEGLDQDLQARASTIHAQWTRKMDQGPGHSGWDQCGQLPKEAVNDDQYVPLFILWDWLKRRNVVETSHKSLYNGLRLIPTDLTTVVASLMELSCPKQLYKTPLILPYAVMDKVEETSVGGFDSSRRKPVSKKPRIDSKGRKWRIRIAVYANRLLPEVMTSHDLHIIMTALDQGSYRTLEPLHIPPSPTERVFESSPTPVVVTEDFANVSDSQGEEKKSDDFVDATFGDSTRDESRISAFSVKGFLKLLENEGNDISNWSVIEPKIAPVLKLNLMLHQQHAICWMLQMESLGGFGINSILWEEREFLDGGKYYYSPALGQIRLSPPPVMKGGILADEQGLGKTLEVLGLIVASLHELKQEAATKHEEGDLTLTHATLIIVPPALVSQWHAEIRKAVGDALIVHFFDPETLAFVWEGTRARANPDIVITTYAALQNNKSSRKLSSLSWGRIVLDEMQEIRSSTTKIAKNCDNLVCQRRWMLSGTPLFDGIDDLRGELQFLRLSPYAAGLEDGFFKFSITSHWHNHSLHCLETLRILGLLILRRSKSMTIAETKQPLMGLKPLTVEFVPIPQDPSERALYCFLESIVSRLLEGDKEKTAHASRSNCLTKLREMCISAVLLSGGMGLTSQLGTLNRWMVMLNRREMAQKATNEGTAARHGQRMFPFACHSSTFSCDEAIRYLSSAHEDANVGDDFVSSLSVGMGGGLSSRNRAAEDVPTQIKETEEMLDKATEALKAAETKKARSLWHLALEKITTGHISIHLLAGVNQSYALLWKLRSATVSLSTQGFDRAENMPALLMRGWRPSTSFIETDLYEKRPEFAWAHARSYQVLAIPSSVTLEEIKNSILAVLIQDGDECITDNENRVNVVSCPSAGESSWRAVLQFLDQRDYDIFEKKANSANGIALACKEIAPQLQAVVDSTKENLEQALAEHKVLPSAMTQRNLAIAKKEHDRSLLGLRIVFRSKGHACHLSVACAQGPCRSTQPLLFTDLCKIAATSIVQYDVEIKEKTDAIRDGSQRLMRLRRTERRQGQVSDDIQALTVFEALCALSDGEKDKTRCPVCLCNLGESMELPRGEQSALVAMTNCGHLFCADCLKDYANNRVNQGRYNICCPSCRRAFDQKRPVVLVDPEKTSDRDALEKRRERAKALVVKVARLLDESYGQLEPDTWEELYLSIDLPSGADCARHSRLNAIPGDFLAHLRAATRIQLDASPGDMPITDDGVRAAGLSSKVRALLADLPRNERSVVFSESKSAVIHLMVVLKKAGIGCRALFSMQAIPEAEVALQDWKSSSLDELGNELVTCPVLVVQAGAAASGLTLTAACKMFIMEPFSRVEEEQQAYARCHRYGQQQPVHVKCYYVPVSVESRLLEWRKRAFSDSRGIMTQPETQIVYSSIADGDATGQQEAAANESEAEQNRTSFLLGLNSEQLMKYRA